MYGRIFRVVAKDYKLVPKISLIGAKNGGLQSPVICSGENVELLKKRMECIYLL